MERNNGKMVLIIGAVVVVLLAIGVWAWSMSNDADEAASPATDSEITDNATQSEDMTPASEQNIVETAMETDSLSTLVTAVQAAGLAETLQGEGPYTVFAPSNSAFEKLPEGTLDTLLQEENREQLASLLQYHVVEGAVLSSDLRDGQTITTLNGETLTVELSEGMAILIDATGERAVVDMADIQVSNGVVHIIDSVVMPE